MNVFVYRSLSFLSKNRERGCSPIRRWRTVPYCNEILNHVRFMYRKHIHFRLRLQYMAAWLLRQIRKHERFILEETTRNNATKSSESKAAGEWTWTHSNSYTDENPNQNMASMMMILCRVLWEILRWLGRVVVFVGDVCMSECMMSGELYITFWVFGNSCGVIWWGT